MKTDGTEFVMHEVAEIKATSGRSGRNSWLDIKPVYKDGHEGMTISFFFQPEFHLSAAKIAQAINVAQANSEGIPEVHREFNGNAEEAMR